jgi:hypothetical protein
MPIFLARAEAPGNFVACVERNSYPSPLAPLLHLLRHGGCGGQDEREEAWQDAGWKRRMHEKLTVNERMVDGKPVE